METVGTRKESGIITQSNKCYVHSERCSGANTTHLFTSVSHFLFCLDFFLILFISDSLPFFILI